MTTRTIEIEGFVELGLGERITEGCIVTLVDPEGTVVSRRPVHGDEVGLFTTDNEYEEGVRYFRPVVPPPDSLSLPMPGTVGFATGAKRSDATGRGRFDLIPYEAMLSLARRYEAGAVHFGDRNWEKGQPLSRLLSSMRRHAHQIGYDFSEDHVGAVLWNAAAFVTMVERMRAGILPRDLDDIGFFLNEEATKR